MILSFRSPQTERLFQGRSSRVPVDIQAVALRKLAQLHAAASVLEMRVPPGNRLEKLTGDREGQWSVRINDQWRLCFLWREGADGPEEVEIVDYH